MDNNALILIVDDRADQRAIFELMACKLGFAAHVVDGWAGARASLEAVAYDLILMDLQMPEIDGIEATREVRRYDEQNKRYTPVVAVTARAMDGDKKLCLEHGMDDYLSKPFTMAELSEKVAYWVEQSHIRNDGLTLNKITTT